jgi:hypothetical protein
MRKLGNKIAVTTEGSRGVGFATARRNFIKTAGIAASATLLPSRLQAKGKETFQNAGGQVHDDKCEEGGDCIVVVYFHGKLDFMPADMKAQ